MNPRFPVSAFSFAKLNSLVRFALLFAAVGAGGALRAAAASSPWRAPAAAGVVMTAQPGGQMKIETTVAESVIDSVASLPAKGGDAFLIEVRTKVGIDMNTQPELACFDAQGREIPPPVPIPPMRQSTTQWQKFSKVFIAWPNTASVRARLRTYGRGTLLTDAPSLRPTEIDTYQTGALMVRPHPRTRAGILLESNFGLVNRERVTTVDRDGDGKWALVTVDLDALTAPAQKGEDWRSNFEDNPNVILWTDGAVLKSDTIKIDREPDVKQALHFRTQVRPGPYTVRLSDPGRPIAVSLDRKTWKRYEGGDEIELGELPIADGKVEVWIDACYVDKLKAGPAYFDYVRLLPTRHEPAIERLFAAAKRRPAPLARGKAAETKVPVTVEVPPFAGAKSWPVRCGLPLPQGELVSSENIAVLDGDGRTLPSQSRVTATWPDGSARWVFVEFMHDLRRGGTAGYTVAYGHRVTAAPTTGRVAIERTPDGLEVNTRALRFLVSGARFGVIENVRRASGDLLQREPVEVEIVESGGRVWSALQSPVTRLEVEQAGPLHAVILVETKLAESGKPSSGFYHRARVHAYAGSPLVQVDYFVANADSRPAKDVGGSMASKVAVKSIALKIRPGAKISAVRHEGGEMSASLGSRIQKTEDVVLDYRGNATSGRVAGWLGLSLADGGSLHLGLADFREQFPKALRWNSNQVNVDLWAEEGGAFEWIEGVGKTHHLALYYGEGAAADGALLAAGPVLATAAPEWYVRSGALGDIVTAAESGLPKIEQSLAAHMKGPVIERVGLGFENYGDHSSSGYVKGAPLWDNNEYDLPAACLVHFARTGDRAALRLGLASALHYLDVDTIHYSSQRADWARAQHVHSHGLFGHHTAAGPDFNHAGYVQGLIWYSYLTGDPVGIDGARGIADWTTRGTPILTTGMERLVGHALMTCNDTYEATGEDKYLRAAAALVDQALKWEHPVRSGFLSRIYETPAFYSGSPFCNGVISAGLLKFNSWAQLPEVDATLERFARWTLTDCWVAPLSLASKAGSPRKGGSPQHIGNQGRLMAHVYSKTGDPLFLAAPWRLAVAGYSPDAKPIPGTRSTGLVFNYLPWLLASFHRAGDPTPEPKFALVEQAKVVALAPRAKATVSFVLRNTGAEPIEKLRLSFHSRLDFTLTPLAPAPSVIPPGQTVELHYEVRAPAQVNLSCHYNGIAYGHWSALYERNGRAHLAHTTVKLELKAPAILTLNTSR